MGVVSDIFKENKKILLLSLGLLAAASLAMLMTQSSVYEPLNLDVEKDTYTEPDQVMEEGVDYQALIKTSFGDIKVDLFEDETPTTVNSFLFLSGKKFYDDIIFHRVVRGFVIQAGDPKGTGVGGPGYTFADEITERKYEPYVLAMANAGANTNGSQFFIVSADITDGNIQNLQGNYTLFGKVISGFAVVDSIERVEVDADDKPVNDITIESIQILEN
jgi:cyclophilin family peptidyl-prolyl cis-trans isomerase